MYFFKYYYLFLWIGGIFFSLNLLGKDIPPQAIKDFTKDLGEIQEILHVPGLTAGIIQGDSLIWQHASGWANLEREIPVNPETLFPIASVTKPFAAILLMQLVAEGKIDLEERVWKFLPQARIPSEIKIKHVLSHTSQGYVGETFEYSYRFGWLTKIIEKASGKSFQELLETRILKPLAMKRSIPGMKAKGYEALFKYIAKPYKLRKNGLLERGLYPRPGVRATNGLVSSVADLAKFSIALDKGVLLADSLKVQMFQPFVSAKGDTLAYAQGWFSQVHEGHPVIWHYGQEACFSSLLLKIPDQSLSFILLANSSTLSEHGHLIQGQLLRSALVFSFFKHFIRNEEMGNYPSLGWKSPVDSLATFFESLSYAQEQLCNVENKNAKQMFLAGFGPLAKLYPLGKFEPIQREKERAFYRDELISQLMMYSFLAQRDSTHRPRANALANILARFDASLSIGADPALMTALQRLKQTELTQARAWVEQISLCTAETYPHHSSVLYEVSHFYKNLGDTIQQRRYLEMMLAIPNQSPAWYNVQAGVQLGEYYISRDPLKAKKYLRQVLNWGWNTGGALVQARRLLRTIP